jgi:predicted small lipoprotein YifL
MTRPLAALALALALALPAACGKRGDLVPPSAAGQAPAGDAEDSEE